MPLTSPGNDDDTGENHQPTLRKNTAEPVEQTLKQNRRSIIFTTNIEFSKWGTVFADDKLAAAIIDRIVHHGRLLEFTGQSRRVSEALMFGRNTSAQPEK